MAEKTSPTFYLFYGNDEIALDEAVKRLRAGMDDGPEADLNISEYDGESASVPEIVNAARSMPFLADKRLILVRGLVAHLTRKGAGETGKAAMQRLLDELPNLPATARLVLIERENLRKDAALVKLAATHERGFCREFTVPENSTGWIIDRAKRSYDARLEPAAAAALATVTGGDLRAADSELCKLALYVGTERPITEADVILLTPYVAEANVFNLVDALAEGDARTALTLMHSALEQDRSDPGFRLFALIVRQFRMLLLAREHLSSGGSPKDLATVLKAHPFAAEKAGKQSRNFQVEHLERIYRRLQRYDLEMKTGRIEPRLALELLVASLSRAG